MLIWPLTQTQTSSHHFNIRTNQWFTYDTIYDSLVPSSGLWSINQSPIVSLQVFLGLHDTRDKRLATSRSVEKIYLHPDFQPNNYNNDIALLRLKERVEFNEVVRPVCVPLHHSKVGHRLSVPRIRTQTQNTCIKTFLYRRMGTDLTTLMYAL